MKFWYDTEFLEQGPEKPIIPISIGIVSEDGGDFYAVYRGGREACALSPWLEEFVLPHLRPTMVLSRSDIARGIRGFVGNTGLPEWWGYYSGYDHVVLSQIFHAPKGWPIYTRDIKQWWDALGNPRLPLQGKDEHNAIADARWNRKAWEFLDEYARKLDSMWESHKRGHTWAGL